MVRKTFRVLGATLIVMLVPFLGILVLGPVTSNEWNPTTFERRTCTYWRLPGTDWQLIPAYVQDDSGVVALYIRSKGWLKTGSAPPSSDRSKAERRVSHGWQVARRSSPFGGYQGDPMILMLLLDQRTTDGEEIWLSWSKKKQNLAAVFWPMVSTFAQAGRYDLLPEMFTMAEEASDPQELRESLDEFERRHLS